MTRRTDNIQDQDWTLPASLISSTSLSPPHLLGASHTGLSIPITYQALILRPLCFTVPFGWDFPQNSHMEDSFLLVIPLAVCPLLQRPSLTTHLNKTLSHYANLFFLEQQSYIAYEYRQIAVPQPGFRIQLSALLLCDLGQVTWLFCALVVSYAKWRRCYFTGSLWG